MGKQGYLIIEDWMLSSILYLEDSRIDLNYEHLNCPYHKKKVSNTLSKAMSRWLVIYLEDLFIIELLKNKKNRQFALYSRNIYLRGESNTYERQREPLAVYLPSISIRALRIEAYSRAVRVLTKC